MLLLAYIVKRILYMIPTLILISLVVFFIIQLPPGDWLTSYIARLEMGDETISAQRAEAMRVQYGLDQPKHVQFYQWVRNIIMNGDFGYSFEFNRPVSELIWERLLLTVVVTFTTLIFSWVVAFVIGLYSATHQYSFGDYIASVVGFIGLATPNFVLALVLMWIAFAYFGTSVTGLFFFFFVGEPWTTAKIVDMFKNMWIAIIVIGTASTAGLIRTLRANLLDELRKPYVVTAKSKGLSNLRVLLKYPLRIALIPFISTVGWMLPTLVSGSEVTAMVLGLPTTGPMLLGALRSQDMYLAGTFILLLSTLTVIGTLISDILLAVVDPRIRYE